MAKTSSKKEKKLDLVPASASVAPTVAGGNLSIFATTQLPDKKKLRRISAAPLLKFQDWPIGVTVSGNLTGLVQNLAKDKQMKKSVVLCLHHPQADRSFMVPMTGTIRAALREYLTVTDEDTDNEKTVFKGGEDTIVGKMIFITRRETGHSKKYNKEMFNFDVDVVV